MTTKAAIAKLQPGDVLVIGDGHYIGADWMIAINGLNGTAEKPITIRSAGDGGAWLDGEGKNRPIYIYRSSHIIVEGLDASNSGDSVVEASGSNNITLRRICAWDAADNNTQIFGVHHGEHNLIEDCAGWGIARKIFSASQGGNHNTFRRCFGRWEGSHVVGPKCTFGLIYNNQQNTFENCIGTWDPISMKETYVLLDYSGKPWAGAGAGTYTNYKVQNPYAIFAADGAYSNPELTPPGRKAGLKVRGCIAYTLVSDRSIVLFAGIFATKADDIEIAGCAVSIAQNIKPFLLSRNPGGTNDHLVAKWLLTKGEAASYIHPAWKTSIAGKLPERYWQDSGDIDGNGEVDLGDIGILATNWGKTVYGLSEGDLNGDGVVDVGDKGIVTAHYETAKPLWPWPMEDRIRQAMIRSGRQPISVTRQVKEAFGE